MIVISGIQALDFYPAINAGARRLPNQPASQVSFPYTCSWTSIYPDSQISATYHLIHAMSPTTINQNALLRLKELSAWVSETNKFDREQENLFRCSDEGRHVKVDPLLGELGFNKIKVNCCTAYSKSCLTFSGIRLLNLANYGKNHFEGDSSLPVSVLSFIDHARV